MSITTMEEVFKAGFACGVGYNDEAGPEEANHEWEDYRYKQLLKVSGKDVADDWLKSRLMVDKKPESLKCPECNSEMKERSSQYGKFWGCTNYPRCKGTRDSEGLSKAERQAERDMVKGPFLEPVDNREDVPVESGELYKFKKG